MSRPDCDSGSILAGKPTGSVVKVNGTDAYFAPAPPSDSAPSESNGSVGVVLLSDAFGIPLVNTKLIADKLANELQCDVWIPDLFDGAPLLRVEGMETQLLPDRPGYSTFWDKFRLIAFVILPRIGTILRSRPSVGDFRAKQFIKAIREDRKYRKVGGVGYSYGGAVAARLATTLDYLDSVVICHPAPVSIKEIKGIKIPSSWVCAEAEDDMFFKKKRMQAEAIFANRKDSGDAIPYEFIDYKGTVHGFACRPNLAFEDVKVAFEKSLEQTTAWLRKTLNE
ncbi:Alpha/Beta hydrolase protein [Pisolithus croceorrhizus]|nr:Alpha/Beta hydrolase protein [Pisolithus croceorrhizus]KAI6123494.1 Alpha/Beta hydrolase protein [Pisolithus croceorrhizus]KAI6166775.1 Alpha/Beta hydrolase protein [Pisolithus thermaeus]